MPRKKKDEEGSTCITEVVETKNTSLEGNYFLKEKTNIRFINSGCTTLDCVIGGGWPLGRVVNIVGNKASGKTLLAIEACANFHKQYPDGLIIYIEAEAAFDEGYAEALGMPIEAVNFIRDIDTVEALFDKIQEICSIAADRPVLCIIDSLDALSDKEEKERDITEGTYGAAKAKKLSELFRRSIKAIESSNMCLMVISQTRQKMGVMFGKKKGRSGGDALDFYASQILWVTHIQEVEKQIEGIKRTVAIMVKADCEKNKIGLAYRSCVFPIVLMYGIDDALACLTWLDEAKALNRLGLTKTEIKKVAEELRDIKDPELLSQIQKITKERWYEIEEKFAPKGKKYE